MRYCLQLFRLNGMIVQRYQMEMIWLSYCPLFADINKLNSSTPEFVEVRSFGLLENRQMQSIYNGRKKNVFIFFQVQF